MPGAAALETAEYAQYGRQLVVPELGRAGQERLKAARVLVVGAGGLGCPAIAYLAGAGVGHLTVVDPDTVEVSNLHRQILHARAAVGTPKAESAAAFVRGLNPRVAVDAVVAALTPANALALVAAHDVVLDCTDRPATRYLISDAAVLAERPLVAAAALQTEGQLGVYNHRGGPCYRCLFPVPPPAATVGACADVGILGPVVGVMGVLQALEAIKVVVADGGAAAPAKPALTLFSAFGPRPWRTVAVRGRQAACAVGGDAPTITRANLAAQDYAAWCGAATVDPLDPALRVDPPELRTALAAPAPPVVLDVRPAAQFAVAALPGAVSLPLPALRRLESPAQLPPGAAYVAVCRYGNDSQDAVRELQRLGVAARDLRGGLDAWAELEPEFPRY